VKLLRSLLSVIVFGGLLGCEPRELPHAKPPGPPAWQKGSPEAEHALANAGQPVEKKAKPKPVAVPLEHAKITPSRRIEIPASSGQGFMTSSPTMAGSLGTTEAQAMQQLKQTMERSLEVGPTLVVWVVDQSASATRLTTSALTTAKGMLSQEPFAAAMSQGKLLTAMVGFADVTASLLDPPASKAGAVTTAFDGVKSLPEGKEMLFTAVDEALVKYLPWRTQQGHEMMIVILSDEPGDDLHKLESCVKNAKKAAVPVYAIGETVPLGKVYTPPVEFGDKNKVSQDRTLSADALRSDLAPIQFWSNGYGNNDNFDSGFGPWPLERLCRESEGRFFGVSSSTNGVGAMRADPAVISKYAPDYVSVTAYEQLLAENRCRDRLIKAAQMDKAEAMVGAKASFMKGNNEARFTQALTQAQRDPARLEPAINRMYDVLAEAEGDRAKLTGARWQAAYDTAYGRICAAKARIDGYNAMLAMLKRGKTFTNPDSKGWVLDASDKIETGSAIQKIADKAKLYLERVKTEHAGTPWARMAADELQTPLGWTWVEQ
jgi:hypothetical protein